MEYEEDQDEEHEEEIGLGSSYNDSVPNSTGAAAPKLNSPPPPLRKGRYKECLKNQAIGIGGHAVDGCGEFIPVGEEDSPESLKCAACNCHRNFHRKEADGGGAFFPFPHHRQQQLLLEYRTPGGYLHVAQSQQQRAPLLALPSSSGGRGDGEEYNYCSNPSSGSQKKRFRTKFSQEQKDKMVNLAERLGWRIQKQDEELVQHFCSELGIKRQVLKVWMHNNKHTSLANKT